MTHTDPYESWKKGILEAARENATSTQPDDDIAPVLLMETSKGLAVVPLGELMSNPEVWLEAKMKVLPSLIAELKATRAALVSCAWVSKADPKTLKRTGERREAINICFGRPESVTTYRAALTRRKGQPPELGEWEADSETGGDIPDALRLGLVAAQRASRPL